MNCSGVNVATGEPVKLSFDRTIVKVEAADLAGRSPEAAVWLAPGFVDLQVNGFAGVDFNDPDITIADIGRAVDRILSTGVTRFLPTVITGDPDVMLACLANLQRARRDLPLGRAIAGFHVEGPFIGPEEGPRGAHPKRWVREPDLAEYRRWQEATEGAVRIVTLSPHWREAPTFIREIVNDGVVAALGHTGADSAAIAAGVDAGATLSTHLGNAAPSVLPKTANCIWDQLAEDRLSASFIVDGLHLGDSFFRSALRAKTPKRAILVTDAAAPAGAAPGMYRLGEQSAELTADGRVVLAGTDKLAGSALLMNDAIANTVRLGSFPLHEAVQMATCNPAGLIALEGRMRGLAEGEAADLVAFRMNGKCEIAGVWLDGEKIC
jgi:N-acetylglucosamine-6-phosphate deacetylase